MMHHSAHARTLLVLSILSLLAPLSLAEEVAKAKQPVTINVAEAIIEPFWDPELSRLDLWEITPNKVHGLHLSQSWCAVNYEWRTADPDTAVLQMTRDFTVDCSYYDHLIVRLALPDKARLRLQATTDAGVVDKTFPISKSEEKEYLLPLEGGKILKKVVIEISCENPGTGMGWIRWLGFRDSGRFPLHQKRWDYSAQEWDTYLRSEDFVPDFEPRHGIFVTPEELKQLRTAHAEAMEKEGRSRWSDMVQDIKSMHFEQGIHEFAKTGGRITRHGRSYYADLAKLPGNEELALGGLILRDPELLRAAARFALSLAMSNHWMDGFIARFPGSSWEHRGFRPSYCAEDIAYVLDLAGDIFTEGGRIYLMRRLAEAGVGPINYVTWRHEYIFHCNQLAYFNTGRIMAYLVMEREWPRVKPYTDLAYQDAIDNLETVFMPDGGCAEGPSYFAPTARENYHAIKYYAQGRGIPLAESVPDILRSTSNFAALLLSTTDRDMIPICDGNDRFSEKTLAVLVELMPESYWTFLANKQRRGQGLEALPGAPDRLPAYLAMPDMGPIASVREWEGEWVKILVMGHNAAHASHTHEDKGSFVLEFAGDVFAEDLGVCDYGDPLHHQYKHCQRHNMLVPTGEKRRPHPPCPLTRDVKPTGEGDETRFKAQVDLSKTWRRGFKKWVRSWDSPRPNRLTIRDEYTLSHGDGVAWYWQCRLPVAVKDGKVYIEGKRGIVEITPPPTCTVEVETLPLHGGESQNRIAFLSTEKSGVLEVEVALQKNNQSDRSDPTDHRTTGPSWQARLPPL